MQARGEGKDKSATECERQSYCGRLTVGVPGVVHGKGNCTGLGGSRPQREPQGYG